MRKTDKNQSKLTVKTEKLRMLSSRELDAVAGGQQDNGSNSIRGCNISCYATRAPAPN